MDWLADRLANSLAADWQFGKRLRGDLLHVFKFTESENLARTASLYASLLPFRAPRNSPVTLSNYGVSRCFCLSAGSVKAMKQAAKTKKKEEKTPHMTQISVTRYSSNQAACRQMNQIIAAMLRCRIVYQITQSTPTELVAELSWVLCVLTSDLPNERTNERRNNQTSERTSFHRCEGASSRSGDTVLWAVGLAFYLEAHQCVKDRPRLMSVSKIWQHRKQASPRHVLAPKPINPYRDSFHRSGRTK